GAVPAGAGAERRALELSAPGLTWVHLERPDAAAAHALAERFGWHELDVEDERLREELLAKGSGRLLYEVLDDLFDYCFPILDKIGHKLDSVEDDMFE